MAEAKATRTDIALRSEWTCAGGAITAGPTTYYEGFEFVISGIPAGSAIQSAAFSGVFGSPLSGADELRVNNISIGTGSQTVPLTALSGGNGTYTVYFLFRVNGAVMDAGDHYGVVVVDSPTVTVTYTLDDEEEEKEEEEETRAANTAEQIALFAPDATDFSTNGLLVLTPFSAEVSETAGGEFALNLQHPMDEAGKWSFLLEEYLIRCPTPEKHTPRIVLPPTALWQVSASETPLYSVLPSYTKAQTPVDDIKKNPSLWDWDSSKDYAAGEYITWEGSIYMALEDNAGVNPLHDNIWEWVMDLSGGGGGGQTPEYIYDPGEVAETLEQGEIVSFVADYNGDYMRVRSMRGVVGYVLRGDCAQTGSQSQTVIPARDIMAQVFRIKTVTVNDDIRTVSVYAQHISYDFGANKLYDCQMNEASPPTAIAMMQGATMTPDARLIATPISSPAVTQDWSWGSPLSALLDPDSGLVRLLRAQLIRDNGDFFLLPNDTPATGVTLRYGVNLQGVSWERNVSDLVTRVVPRGTTQDGGTLLLPEVFIDSDDVLAHPLIYVEVLDCGCQVGQTVKHADGTEQTLTLEDCYTLMREKAQQRFDTDKCDAVGVRLTVKPLLLGDTEEYAPYRGLEKLHLYDAVSVSVPHALFTASAQMSAYTWDAAPGRHRFISITLGEVFSFGGRSVTGYNVENGAISYAKLSPGLVKKIRSLTS